MNERENPSKKGKENPSKEKISRINFELAFIFLDISILIISVGFCILDVIEGRENSSNWLFILILILVHTCIEVFFYIFWRTKKEKAKVLPLPNMMLTKNDFTETNINSNKKKKIIMGCNFFILLVLLFSSIFGLKFSPKRNQLYEVIIFESVVFYLKIRGALELFGLAIRILIILCNRRTAKVAATSDSMHGRRQNQQKEEEKDNQNSSQDSPTRSLKENDNSRYVESESSETIDAFAFNNHQGRSKVDFLI